jgi:hypothetical protein
MLSDAQRKASQRERTAKHREKLKARSAEDVLANEQKRRDEFDQWRTEQRLVTPGEREALINAESVEDALQVAREFLVALNQPDLQPGETLRDVERRTVSAWCAAGAGLLNRNTLRIDASTASTIDGYTFDFDTKWIPLEGADAPIDITLPIIVVPEIVEAPAVVQAPPAPQWDDPALKNYRTPEVAAICKAQQDACDANARAIGKKNLQRELDKEKRLGPAYAYEQ